MEIHAIPERLIQIGDLFGFLRGRWAVDRKITDHQLSTSGSFSGLATFTMDKGNLRYREEGRFRFADHDDTAFRQYHFVFSTPVKANVFFEDGRAFHDLDLSTGQWTAIHECGSDLYRGLFQVTSERSYTARWVIHGPAKDMILNTDYRRDHAGHD